MRKKLNLTVTLAEFVDSFPEAIFLKGPTGEILMANEAHINGVRKNLPNAEVIGQKDDEFFKDVSELDRIKKDDSEVLQGRIIYDKMEENSFPYDSKHHISTTKVPWKKGKKICGLFGISRDVSGRVALFHDLFNSHVDCCFVTSRKGKWLQINKSGLALFGYADEREFKETKVIDCYYKKSDRFKYIKKMAKEGFVKDYDLKFKKKSGEQFWAKVTSSVRRDEKNRIIGYHGIIRDVTEERMIEDSTKERVEELNRRLFQAVNGQLKWFLDNQPCSNSGLEKLNDQEKKTLELILHAGKKMPTNKEIAKALKTSTRNVEGYCLKIYKKLKIPAKEHNKEGIIRHFRKNYYLVEIPLPYVYKSVISKYA